MLFFQADTRESHSRIEVGMSMFGVSGSLDPLDSLETILLYCLKKEKNNHIVNVYKSL